MANPYIIIKDSNDAVGLKFRVIQGGYKDILQKTGSTKPTIGGVKDRVEGSVYRTMQFVIRTSYALDAYETTNGYGTKGDLETYYKLTNPNSTPSNLLTLIDFLGNSYTGWLVGDFVPDPVSTVIDGNCAYFFIQIMFEVKDAE